MVKAKQVEYLIQSLPEPEAEEQQVRRFLFSWHCVWYFAYPQAKRLQILEDDMNIANDEYIQAVTRASECNVTISCLTLITEYLLTRRRPAQSSFWCSTLDAEWIRYRHRR